MIKSWPLVWQAYAGLHCAIRRSDYYIGQCQYVPICFSVYNSSSESGFPTCGSMEGLKGPTHCTRTHAIEASKKSRRREFV